MPSASFFSGSDSGLTAADVIAALELAPFPAGGHGRETHRCAEQSVMLVLLEVGDVLPWHRYQGVQSWFWHAGAPLAVTVSPDGHDASALHLGNHLDAGQETPDLCCSRPLDDRGESRPLDVAGLELHTRLHGRSVRAGSAGLVPQTAATGCMKLTQ